MKTVRYIRSPRIIGAGIRREAEAVLGVITIL